MGRSIVIYFSRKGENYWNGSMKMLEKGNTEIVAEMAAELTGSELFQVEAAEPYPEDYRACVAQAAKEWKEGARPEVRAYPENLDAYDRIYLGYPNWCGTMPMVMFTFLEHFDLTGKQIFPFCTNEGSGMERSETDLKQVCRGAKIEKGLSIHGAEAAQSRRLVEEWLTSC